jgi:hypothetical protein
MAKKTDELVVEIKGDISDLSKKLDKAVNDTKKASDDMGGAFGGLNNPIGKASIKLGAFGLAVEGAQKLMVPFIKALDQLASTAGIVKTADRVGLTTGRFQELAFAARSVGVDSETMADAIKDLGVKITDAANGATSYEEALNLVGLSSKELMNLPVDEQFRRFADAMSQANDATRRFVADEINDSMFQLNGLLKEGSAGLDSMAKEARELNAVLSQTDLNTISEANKELEILKAGFDGLLNEVIVALAPAMKAFLESTVDGLKELNKWLGISVPDTEKLADAQKRLLDIEEKLASKGDRMSRSKAALLREQRDILKEIADIQRSIFEEEQATAPIQGPANQVITPFDFSKDELSKQFGKGKEGESDEAKEEEGLYEGQMEGVPWIFTEEGLSQMESWREEELRKQQEFNEALQGIDKAHQEYNRRLWESGWKGKTQIMSSALGSMTTLMNSENRKMFEVGKAAAIAQVAIDTPKAAMSAFSAMAGIPIVGPALGAVAAAAAIATGIGQLNNIKSQSFGGGGGGGAGSVVSPDAGAAGVGAQEQQTVTNVTEATINITGDNISGDSARALVAQLREYQEDGGELLIK